jgi:hypothetical protein
VRKCSPAGEVPPSVQSHERERSAIALSHFSLSFPWGRAVAG